MPHGLSVISVIWLPLKRRPLVLREIKKIVSSVRDKNNTQSDWREDIFYNGRNGNKTEERKKSVGTVRSVRDYFVRLCSFYCILICLLRIYAYLCSI